MATTPSSATESTGLQGLIGPLWRRKWLLLVILVLSTGGTYALSARRPSRFQSSTQVFVAGSQIASIVNGGAVAGTDRSTLDQATLLVSLPVTQAVIKELHLPDSPAQLARTVTATPVPGSNFVTVTAQRRSAAQAAAVANAYVQAYIRYRNSQLVEQANAARALLTSQLRSIPVRVSTQQQRQGIQDTLHQIAVTEAAAPSESSQTQLAVAPTAPFTPRPKRDAAFAIAIALALGLALVLGLERLDRRIKTVEEVPDVYELPLLSVIPHTASPVERSEGQVAVPNALREPFRTLRTNLQLASLDKPIRRIVVASAVAGEGKSTIVTNLALTYREYGLSVVVVEADLRRPTLSASFGVAPGPGLTRVLTGECELDEALTEVSVDAAGLEFLDRVQLDTGGSPRGAAVDTATKSKLMLLSSGEAPPNPQAALAADKMANIVDQLADRFDAVLIDTPPLLAVSDAIPLILSSDAVVLVTRVGVTERGAARRAVVAAQIDPSVRVLGVVANDVTRQPGGGYGYGYGYGYGKGYG